MPLSRRDFVRSSIAAGVAASAVPTIHAQSKAGKVYKTALVGSGWWGTNILREAIRSGECKPVAICDVDGSQIEKCKSEMAKETRDDPKVYRDFREMLEKETPEIVIVATPDHWHPLITIAAVKAGAHVYVEKPIGHTIDEGKAMVKGGPGDGEDRAGRHPPEGLAAQRLGDEVPQGREGRQDRHGPRLRPLLRRSRRDGRRFRPAQVARLGTCGAARRP